MSRIERIGAWTVVFAAVAALVWGGYRCWHVDQSLAHSLPATGNSRNEDRSVASPLRPNVYVGVFLNDVSDFDIDKGQFHADIDVWEKWAGAEGQPPKLRYANAVLEDDPPNSVGDEVSDGGWNTRRFRVQGTFRGQFDLRRFPRDTQFLDVVIESEDGKSHLVPDAVASGMEKDFSITGWKYERAFAIDRKDRDVASDFGTIDRDREGQHTNVEALVFRVTLERPFTSYMIKFLLPLSIIASVAMSVFFIGRKEFGVRASIGVTGVLSCIAYHFTQADSLPVVNYLVMADGLFLGAYVCVASALFETLTVHWLEPTRPEVAKRVDQVARVLMPGAFALWCVGVFTFAPSGEGHEPGVSVNVATAPTPTLQPGGGVERHRSADTSIKVFSIGESRTRPQLTSCGLAVTRGTPGGQTETVSWLVDEVPSITNDLVHFLPDGGMIVRWRLRPGLKWGDGRAIDAADMEFSFNKLDSRASQHADVRIVDTLTVDVTWEDRKSSNLTEPIYPRHIFEVVYDAGGQAAAEKLGVEPTSNAFRDAFAEAGRAAVEKLDEGTAPAMDGPFVYVGDVADGYRHYRRNEFFAGPSPLFEDLFICPGRDAKCYSTPLDIVLMPFISEESTRTLLAEPGAPWCPYRGERPGQRLYFVQVGSHDLLRDVATRRALLGAIDRKGLSEAVCGGGTGCRVVETYETGTRSFAATPYNSKKAIAILRPRVDANAPVPLLCVDEAVGPLKTTCDWVERDLTAAQVPISMQRMPRDIVDDVSEAGTFPGLIMRNALFRTETTEESAGRKRAWGLPRVNGILDIGANGVVGYDDRARAQFSLIRSSLYPERREVAYRGLADLYAENLPTLPLFVAYDNSLVSPALRGYDPSTSTTSFEGVEDWYTVDATRAGCAEVGPK